jgi:superfamily II DNA or RNA helicase
MHDVSPDLDPVIRQLAGHYRTGDGDLASSFFSPCLSKCVAYKRAVGFFSSSALRTWTSILSRLAEEEQIKIQLLTSPLLQPQDLEVLQRVSTGAERDEMLQRMADRLVLEVFSFVNNPDDVPRRLRLLAWMIVSRNLEIRFAFPEHIEEPGIYHEKIGVFLFPGGYKVAFIGSANESETAHRHNYESVDVFRSWIAGDEDRVRTKEAEFDTLWEGNAPGLRVLRLSTSALEEVADHARRFDEYRTHGEGRRRSSVHEPAGGFPRLWKHQEEAVRCFLESKQGVLEMATGTGKTRAAIHICAELLRAEDANTIIVTADGTDLLNQWYAQLCEFAVEQSPPMVVYRAYAGHRQGDDFGINPSGAIVLCSRQMLPPVLRRLSKSDAERSLIIHDEVHRLGSPGNRKALAGLSKTIPWRLGLSATPEREYDEEGTQFIEVEVGPVIYRFGLEDAIRAGVLTEFDYVPLEYEPTEEEKQRVTALVRRLNAPSRDEEMSREDLMIAIARVYKTSEAKLPVFAQHLHGHPEILRRCLIFVETKEFGERVLEIIHPYRFDFHTYFAEQEADVLRRFADGQLESLITCHRLSEGIDIRSISTVILFSSARSRLETIQRMGRCLRVDPINPNKRALVIDFVRARDPNASVDNADDERREWLSALALCTREREGA